MEELTENESIEFENEDVETIKVLEIFHLPISSDHISGPSLMLQVVIRESGMGGAGLLGTSSS